MNSYEDSPSFRKVKLSLIFCLMVCSLAILIAFTGAALAQSLWPESHIDCEKSRWELTVEDPEGLPVTVQLPRSRIILCGWVIDGWQMFTFSKRGCILKPEDRFWMRNVDAARIRECFQ
ncbi:MAG: hypothetical protein OXM01_00630 [Gemmatimonadota bacterium]|nr:hypothetical protein [Gemmatimonadota bacterium]